MNNRLAILVPVWGEDYLHTFGNWSLPSQLTPDNIPILAGSGSYLDIYTFPEHRTTLATFKSLAEASRYIDIRINDIDDSLRGAHKFQIAHWCYRTALQFAASRAVGWADLVNPDAFFYWRNLFPLA